MISAPQRHHIPAASRWSRPPRPRLLAAGAIVLLVVIITAHFLNKYWPFRYRQVEPLLQSVLASQIKIEKYHRVYFPHPGFVATGLTLRRNSAPNLPPVGTAQSLIVTGRWSDLLLLRHRIRMVDVTGLHIIIPPVGSPANRQDFPQGSSADFAGPTTPVAVFHVHDSMLEIQRTNGGSYRFPIRDLVIRDLQRGHTIAYTVDMQNAMPTGHIVSTGHFGPLLPGHLAATRVSGDFTFDQIQLSDIGNLHGILSTADHFEGKLSTIDANATASTSDFAVNKGKPTPLQSNVHLTINALDRNILLHSVDARIGRTTIHAAGDILGSPKTTNLDIRVENGRVEDLMRPFLHDQVPLAGAVWLNTHARLLPARHADTFFQRLQVDGAFNVPAERLTNRHTEKSLTAFSQRAQGKPAKPGNSPQLVNADLPEPPADPTQDVLASLGGPLHVRNGVVTSSSLAFQFPGARVHVAGTYNLQSTEAHFTGNLLMQSDVSHVTTGFKSILLKPLAPFFRRKSAGADIPIAITGTSGDYKISQNVLHNK